MALTNLNKRLDRRDRYAYSQKKKKRSWKKILIVLALIIGLLYLPLRGVYTSAKTVIDSGRAVQEAAKRENLDDIRKNLKQMRDATGGLNTSLNVLFWVRIIPFLGGYYADAKAFTKAAEYELSAASTIADSLDPYKNELGFTGNPDPGRDRVVQMVKILDKVIPQLDKVEPDLKKAADEVKNIDTNKYPEKIGKSNLKSRVEAAKNLIVGAHYSVTEGRPALEVAPAALGEPSAKNYLIIFQNDKELRPTGGFMTAYASMKLDKGRLSASSSDDIYRLDEKLLRVCQNKICPLTPPAPLVKYLPEANGKPRTAWSMRDSNISPDLPTSAGQFERMYQLLGEGLPYDGILFIDTHVVEKLIEITGPVEVFGTKYSADHDDRCNCPNVIYELENYAQIIEKGQEDRKAILGTLMQQILARALGTSVEKLPEFIDAGVKLANSKHMMFYMHDGKTQSALSKLNWTGEIRNGAFDYLNVNDANFAGGKTNIYVERSAVLEIDTKNVDHVKNKLTLEYKNPQKYNTWLNGINRTYIRVYVPKGAKLIASKGSDVQVTTIEEELGKTVFEAFIQVRPENSRKLEFEYELPSGFKDKEYPIMVQKQPGTKDFDYTIKLNGKQKEKFKLDTDKEFKLSL